MMRLLTRVLAVLTVSMMLALPTFADSGNVVGRIGVGIEVYLWNRISDFLDILQCGIGVGPSIGAEVAVTNNVQFGAYAANEKGVSFPHFLPPLWFVPYLEGKPVLRHHQGDYKTYVYGVHRWENSPREVIRFDRSRDMMARVQVGLGIVHLYAGIDFFQIADFFAGLVNIDLANDDIQADPSVRRAPALQLGRGITNILTGVLEIPHSIHMVNQEKGGFAALTYGTLQGFGRFITREAVGVLEVVTFPMGWGPIIEPEFPFQETRTTQWRVNQPQFSGAY